MKGYDFDKTIYDGDCFVDFYLFCLKKFFYIALLLPIQLLLFLFVFKSRKLLKQCLAIYLPFIPNKKKQIQMFWDKNSVKIKKWYLAQQQPDDIVISASPEFLIFPICEILNIKNAIATKMNLNNGKITGKNCWGVEKTIRFKEKYNFATLDAFYSDSKSDLPMMKISKSGFLVNKDKITQIL